MSIRIGSRLDVPAGYSFFLDATIPESYAGSGSTWTNLANTSSNCTLTNSPTFSRTGTGAGALTFNGSSMYGSCSDLSLGGNFTLLSWIKKSDTSSEGYILGGGWQSAITALNFGVTNATPTLNNGWGWGGRTELAAGTITTDAWYHLCAVKSSNVAYMYVNGVQVGSASFSVSYDAGGAAATSYIGRSAYESPNFFGDPGDYKYFGGMIGMVLVYNSTVLTAAQILENYNQTKSRYSR